MLESHYSLSVVQTEINFIDEIRGVLCFCNWSQKQIRINTTTFIYVFIGVYNASHSCESHFALRLVVLVRFGH